MPMNPTKLKPIEIVRIVNTTPLNAVLNDRQLRRHRDRAGFRISDDGGQTVNLIYGSVLSKTKRMNRPLKIAFVLFAINVLIQGLIALGIWGLSQGG